MPSYDYNCKQCNENFTIEKSMSDTSTPNCPKCNSEDVAKDWGGFQLKGCCKTSGASVSSGGGCGSCSGGSCSGCH